MTAPAASADAPSARSFSGAGLQSLGQIATGANKLVFLPYEASGALGALGGMKELLDLKPGAQK